MYETSTNQILCLPQAHPVSDPPPNLQRAPLRLVGGWAVAHGAEELPLTVVGLIAVVSPVWFLLEREQAEQCVCIIKGAIDSLS